ncbi:amino acid ABC transporter ATP-binding protein [Paracoccus suum]|uniref:Amino acid ABC transporter ATP-binding protein n=1 Tax=Paracoccus suum TaxID=2259340 RepID=A0A344PKT9_9RHOB|nr:ATP-binding cassette domain-containing protein [Paracoccus suum]AXC49994.1 amino acid ABC transporter ATP-binding protein [Paracoccus suum]
MSRPALQITGLCRQLGAFPALRGISLGIEPGEHVALIGPSGSGKAMLLRCLRELDSFQRGRVEVAGEFIAAPAPPPPELLARMRRRLPFVAAEPDLPAGCTVLSCCASTAAQGDTKPTVAEEEAAEVLDRLGLGAIMARMTESLGVADQQRAAIARAVAARGEVTLLDDPASCLSGAEAQAVLNLMSEVKAAGTTMLSAVESLDFVRQNADRVVFMDRGQVVEVAATECFFTAPSSARAAEFLAQRGA